MTKLPEYGEALEREIENQAKKLTTLEERTSKKYKQGFVYDYLKTSIITGRLPPEKQLIEREICDKLGVSRTPVREAFRQLSSEGLVNFLPGCGVVVSAMTKEKAEELYQLKEALECMAARLCAERAPEDHIKKMADCIEQHSQAYIDVEPLAAVDLDLQFHVLILEGAPTTRAFLWMGMDEVCSGLFFCTFATAMRTRSMAFSVASPRSVCTQAHCSRMFAISSI